jgi:hypothetical protein
MVPFNGAFTADRASPHTAPPSSRTCLKSIGTRDGRALKAFREGRAARAQFGWFQRDEGHVQHRQVHPTPLYEVWGRMARLDVGAQGQTGTPW